MPQALFYRREDEEYMSENMDNIFNDVFFKELINTIKTPDDLLRWMNQHIRYSNFLKLKSPQEVFKSKTGSCHDQVIFELFVLRKIGLHPKAIFLIEYNPDTMQGGVTHSFVYFSKNDKIYWFEHAWGGEEGIHEYSSLKEIKNDIRNLHKTKKIGNIDQFNKLQFFNFKAHKFGESLQQFVDIATK